MRYVSEEELRKWILKEGCDDGCGYIDERDLEQMQWEQEPFINLPCISTGVCREHKDKVLDQIRAEIEKQYGNCAICEYFEDFDYEENDISEYREIGYISDILQIIDKYKAESEDKE